MELADYWRILRAHWVGVVLIVAVATVSPPPTPRPSPRCTPPTPAASSPPAPPSNAALGSVNDALAKSRADVVRRHRDEPGDGAGGHRRPRASTLSPPRLVGQHQRRAAAGHGAARDHGSRRHAGGRPGAGRRLGAGAGRPGRRRSRTRAGRRAPTACLRVLPVEAAALPASPVSPHPPAQPADRRGAVGLLLGLAYALMRHSVDRRLRSKEEIESKFPVSVVGSIPTAPVLEPQGRRCRDMPSTRRAPIRPRLRRGVPQAAHQPDVHERRQPAQRRRSSPVPLPGDGQVHGRSQPGGGDRPVRRGGRPGRRRPPPPDRRDVVRASSRALGLTDVLAGRHPARRRACSSSRRATTPADPGRRRDAAQPQRAARARRRCSSCCRSSRRARSSSSTRRRCCRSPTPPSLAASADGAFVVRRGGQDPRPPAAPGRSQRPSIRPPWPAAGSVRRSPEQTAVPSPRCPLARIQSVPSRPNGHTRESLACSPA